MHTHIAFNGVCYRGVAWQERDSRHSCWHNGGFLLNVAVLYIITPWVYCRSVKCMVLIILKKKNVRLIILQYTGWYDDSIVGGIEGSISKMIAADPTFGEFN